MEMSEVMERGLNVDEMGRCSMSLVMSTVMKKVWFVM